MLTAICAGSVGDIVLTNFSLGRSGARIDAFGSIDFARFWDTFTDVTFEIGVGALVTTSDGIIGSLMVTAWVIGSLMGTFSVIGPSLVAPYLAFVTFWLGCSLRNRSLFWFVSLIVPASTISFFMTLEYMSAIS